MGFLSTKALVLIQLSVLLLGTVQGDEVDLSAQSPIHHAPIYPPAEAPTPNPYKGRRHHHHYHNKTHPHPPGRPTSAPTPPPPAKPPVHPPSSPPPAKPPVHPPAKPPVHPPSSPPTAKPPVHPPAKPPVHPPSSPPTPKPPVHPPATPPSPPSPGRKLVAVQGVVYCKSCKYIGVDTLLNASALPGAIVRLLCYNTKYPLKVEAKTDKNGYFLILPQKQLTTSGVHKCRVSLVSSPLATCNQTTNLNDGATGAIPVPAPKSYSTKPLEYQLFNVGPFAFEPAKKTPCVHGPPNAPEN